MFLSIYLLLTEFDHPGSKMGKTGSELSKVLRSDHLSLINPLSGIDQKSQELLAWMDR